MIRSIRKRTITTNDEGASAVEYGLLVAAIAAVIVVVVFVLGGYVQGAFDDTCAGIADGGTTNAELVRALPRDLKVTIATHSPTIAAGLEHHAAEVILIGGRQYKHSMVSVGAIAMEAIIRLSPDIFFLGVTGLHSGLGLSTGDAEEAAIKRTVSVRSAETWVMATAAKFDVVSPHHVIGVKELTGLVVPAGLAEATTPYRDLHVEVIEAA